MPITPRSPSPRLLITLGLAVMVAAAGGLLLHGRPTPAPTAPGAVAAVPRAAVGAASTALPTPEAAVSNERGAVGALGAAVVPAPAPGQVTGADIARLSQYELVALPSRAEPIERWRAQRYFCPADFNRDDVIDGADTTAFLEAFASRTGPFAEFLDVNRDGAIDAADLEAFVHATETPCDPAKTAENRLISC